jgi:hypothetical protein
VLIWYETQTATLRRESGWAAVTQELKIAAKSAKLEWEVSLSAVLRCPQLSPNFATHFPTLFPTPGRSGAR